MNKKMFGIALVLLVFFTIGSVFAQVCLSKSAAKVRDRGSSVDITNTMDEDINVEIQYKTPGRTPGVWNNDDFMVFVGAKATVSKNLPSGAKYVDYEVYSCTR